MIPIRKEMVLNFDPVPVHDRFPSWPHYVHDFLNDRELQLSFVTTGWILTTPSDWFNSKNKLLLFFFFLGIFFRMRSFPSRKRSFWKFPIWRHGWWTTSNGRRACLPSGSATALLRRRLHRIRPTRQIRRRPFRLLDPTSACLTCATSSRRNKPSVRRSLYVDFVVESTLNLP